ncbi:MAG: alanyl-tRNA synthetase [Parcubacteria group bacterium Gr01-1014_13]|nr:MAG: alanyl-tRNA synthetase [Parcubacteria group bacterium Gr01-1014_13]
MLTSVELRQKYQDFFKSKGHTIIPSASLVPENDPTVLFTTAGMHPLVPYLLGEKHPGGNRLANVQKCIRTQDIDEVGDNRHDTFFEMLGNWSLGDYFKKEAIAWSWEFLTSKTYLGIDPRKLAVTVFAGDNDAPVDNESAEIWKSLGVPEHKIGYLPKKNNWWGPAGQTGPCGPDTEMFFWSGESELPPEDSNPANDEDNWLEIWNDVFMQYFKKADGTFEPLKQKNVDTGMGLERTLVVLNGYADVFQIDTFWPLIQTIQNISGREYIESKEVTRSMRIIADHLRTATMIMGDDKGIAPSNTDQGYIVRRLIRRAVRHGRMLGITENFGDKIAQEVIKIFASVYPELKKNQEFIMLEIAKEESKFRNTIEQGLKEFDKLMEDFRLFFEKTGETIKEISGKQAFKLYDTHGFPLEVTQELANERGLTVDVSGFEEEFKKHQDLSRAGAEQKFAGGLADHSEMSVKYHTATHLLHAALQKILGPHATQRGSNITQERMRFDFPHPQKMTPEEIKAAEDLVNAAIAKDYPVSWTEMSFEEARTKGAMGLFEDKYQAMLKVYTVGDPNELADADPNSPTFSREICGGPHVEHTGVLGKFKIVKEEAVSAGIRRIKAILE